VLTFSTMGGGGMLPMAEHTSCGMNLRAAWPMCRQLTAAHAGPRGDGWLQLYA
jgi:hypothetical protein